MIILNKHRITPTIFPDKTSQVWKLPPECFKQFGNKVIWQFENEAEFMHLAQLRELLPLFSDNKLILPYLPYARQDKVVSNGATFALLPFLKLLASLNFHQIMIFDPHNPEAVRTILREAVIVEPIREIEQTVAACKPDVICYPDEGARLRYSTITPQLPALHAEKVRDQSSGAITALKVGDASGLKVLIIDDICDGGATFIRLAEALKGAAEIHLYVSHGLFSRGTQVLRDAGIQRIFTKEGELQ